MALSLLNRAIAFTDYREAYYEMGMMYALSPKCSSERSKAMDYLEGAVKRGSAQAAEAIAKIYQFGLTEGDVTFVMNNNMEALKWYRIAAGMDTKYQPGVDSCIKHMKTLGYSSRDLMTDQERLDYDRKENERKRRKASEEARKVEEGVREKKKMEIQKEKDREKVVVCDKCNGSGNMILKVKCAVCQGSRRVTKETKCSSCSGTGVLQYADVCRRCNGTGASKVECTWCHGKGKTKCYSCDGKGGSYEQNFVPGVDGRNISRRKRKVNCSRCNGRGYVYCGPCGGSGSDGKERCEGCNGTGRMSKRCICTGCGGKGVIIGTNEKCEHCKTGYFENKIKCDKCNGKGMVDKKVDEPGSGG